MVPDLRIEEHGRIRELALGRTALVTVAVALAFAPLTISGQEVESVEGGHLPGRVVCGRDLRIAPALDVCALVLEETGLDPRIDTGLAVTGRGLLTATDHVDSVLVPPSLGSSRSRDLPLRSCDRSRSHGRLPSSTDRSRSREEGRRARREQQEGVGAVKVSQAPSVSEAPAVATPAAGALFGGAYVCCSGSR